MKCPVCNGEGKLLYSKFLHGYLFRFFKCLECEHKWDI